MVAQGRLVLASASPRRAEILTQLRLSFEVVVSAAAEVRGDHESAAAYVARLAEAKARTVATRCPEAYVLGADTVVTRGGQVLEKPRDHAHHAEMLAALSGQMHQVLTAVCVVAPGSAGTHAHVEVTQVVFRALGAEEIARYVAGGEGADKAGGYAVQGMGAGFVMAIMGSYTNVVGLPACQTLTLLREAGAVGDWP